AAANVEQSLSRLQPQLAADHVHLVALGLLQRVAPVGEVAAGVLHLRIEEQLVEIIAEVVVELDVVSVVSRRSRAAHLVARERLLQIDLLRGSEQERQGTLEQRAGAKL